MSEVKPWHREAAGNVCALLEAELSKKPSEHEHSLAVAVFAETIAAHDPSAELLAECAKVISSMMASEEVAEANGYGALSPEDIDAARSALARLAEAGVQHD